MNKIYITKNDTIIGEINRNDLPMSNSNIYECLIENITEDGNYLIGRTYMDVPSEDGVVYIKNDNVIILFGYKNSSFVGYYANILNDVAKKVGIEKIYYYDITEDRKNKNGSYESIVEYLKDYVITFDDGSKNIYAPSFFIKINGVVSLYDDEDAFIKGYSNAGDYFNNYRTNLKKITLQKALEDYVNNDK